MTPLSLVAAGALRTARRARGRGSVMQLPLRDLCDAGGWKDAQTILKCYQQPDEDLIRGVLDARGQPNMAANRQDNRQEGPIYRKQEPRPVT